MQNLEIQSALQPVVHVLEKLSIPDSLDKNYLRVWTKKLGIFELLKNAFDDTEIRL